MNKLKKDNAEKVIVLEKLNTDWEDKVNYLQEELNRLRRDNQEKDSYIKGLRRASGDFQDEAASLEEDLMKNIKKQKRELTKLNSDEDELALRNEDLQMKLDETLKEMSKPEEELGELNKINKKYLHR
ncbi:uncharacterized protein isoform X2 [Leptinotarsa decemlineata]|uniref:uncharacterized protein isoform X2 n=1 Tax=Leptinotarsa decemlineata TaxID=7539 RepID=UPI003D305378